MKNAVYWRFRGPLLNMISRKSPEQLAHVIAWDPEEAPAPAAHEAEAAQ